MNLHTFFTSLLVITPSMELFKQRDCLTWKVNQRVSNRRWRADGLSLRENLDSGRDSSEDVGALRFKRKS